MNMQALYEDMKAALRFFDLGFADKAEVRVSVVGGKIAFECGGRVIMIDTAHDAD